MSINSHLENLSELSTYLFVVARHKNAANKVSHLLPRTTICSLQSMVKSHFASVAHAIIDKIAEWYVTEAWASCSREQPETIIDTKLLSFSRYIFLDNDDKLEGLFGIARSLCGVVSQFDALQLEERLGIIARMDEIFNLHPSWKLPARRLHQSFDHWTVLSWKGDVGAWISFCTGEPVLNVDLGGSWRTGQHTSLGNLRSLSYIRAAELDFARLFGADGLSMLSFDEKAKAGRFSGAEDDSESDSDSDDGAGSSPVGTTADISVATGPSKRGTAVESTDATTTTHATTTPGGSRIATGESPSSGATEETTVITSAVSAVPLQLRELASAVIIQFFRNLRSRQRRIVSEAAARTLEGDLDGHSVASGLAETFVTTILDHQDSPGVPYSIERVLSQMNKGIGRFRRIGISKSPSRTLHVQHQATHASFGYCMRAGWCC